VVGIDGSPQSGKALEWAVSRAALGGQQLELINAYTATPVFDFYGYHAMAATQPTDWFAEHATFVLEAAAERVRELAPDMTCTLKSVLGHAALHLAEASEGAVAVVVGHRGLGAAASAVLGSVSNKLAIQARCPVVVVGEEELPTSGPVVVGVDGSDFGVNALRYALAEAALRRTSVRAVSAYEAMHPAFAMDQEMVDRIRAATEADIDDTVRRVLEDVEGADSVELERVVAEGRPSAGGWPALPVPHTVIPRDRAAPTSTAAFRIPVVTSSRSRGRRTKSDAGNAVRSRMITTISQSPISPTTSSSLMRCRWSARTCTCAATDDQSAIVRAACW
jgi:nucleotide-binding universal stress UspA family protein